MVLSLKDIVLNQQYMRWECEANNAREDYALSIGTPDLPYNLTEKQSGYSSLEVSKSVKCMMRQPISAASPLPMSTTLLVLAQAMSAGHH